MVGAGYKLESDLSPTTKKKNSSQLAGFLKGEGIRSHESATSR